MQIKQQKFSHVKILIVEDDDLIATFIKKNLENNGYSRIEKANSWNEAINLIHSGSFDLILMDINLSNDEDGVELAREILKSNDIPVIFLSGNFEDETIRRAAEVAPYGYLIKPVNGRELFSTIEMALFKFSFEQRLKESEAKYKSLFYDSPVSIIISKIAGGVEECNDAFCKMLGYNKNEIEGIKVRSCIHPDDLKKNDDSISSLQRGKKENVSFTSRYLQKNGSIVWADVSISLQRDSKGKPDYFITVANNITDRKNAEKAFWEESTRRKVIFEESPDGMLVIDPETTKFLEFNSAAHNQLGYTREEFSSLSIFDVEAMESVDDTREKFIKLFNSERADFDTLHRTKNGTIKNVHVTAQILTFEDRRIYFSTWRDITERKLITEEIEKHRNRLEDLVKQRTEEIEKINVELLHEIERKKFAEASLKKSLEKEKELNVLKDRFIRTVSHEFRTPLTAILSSVELIQRYSANWSEEKKNSHLVRISNSVDYLTGLLENVLDINRSESGMTIFNPATHNLKNLFGKIIEEIELSPENRYSLKLNFMSIREEFEFDKKHMNSVISNLISNASKYSPEGSNIEINVNSSEKMFEFSVKDEGIGIPDSDLLYLFKPFHRGSNIGQIRGTGLGLTIVKNAVELHKGAISVFSEINKGTTFKVEIPCGNPLN